MGKNISRKKNRCQAWSNHVKEGVKRGCRPNRPSQIAREERLINELKQKYERLQQEHARMCTRLELFEETKVAATKQLQQQHDQHMAALVQRNQEAFQKQEAV